MNAKRNDHETVTLHPLEWAEMGSLILSIGSSLMVLVTDQAIKFAIPILSFSLLLNFVNRRRMAELILQHTVTTQAQVQHILTEMTQTRQPVVDLTPIRRQLAGLYHQDQQLQRSLDHVVQQVLDIPSSDRLAQLDIGLSRLSEAVSALNHQMEPAIATETSVDTSDLVEQLVQRHLAQITPMLSPTEPITLEQINQLQNSVQELNTKVDQAVAMFSYEVAGIPALIETALQTQYGTVPCDPNLDPPSGLDVRATDHLPQLPHQSFDPS
jgi:hypothetical protein